MAQIGELWLPDMLLNEEYGQGLIHDYFRRDTTGYMYSGAMFDTYPADPASGITAPPSPPDEITDSDLIALSMLGIRVTGYEALIITQDRRKEIETLLASIPRTRTSSRRQAEGSLLPKATRGSCGSYCARRRTGRRRPGSAPSPRASSWPVSAPHLIPIEDSQLAAVFRRTTPDRDKRWWDDVHSAALDPSPAANGTTLWCYLARLRDQASQDHLPVLRVLDIIGWMHARRDPAAPT